MDEHDNHRLDDAATASTVDISGNLKPWVKGQSGNPKGRAKGSRNKLSSDFISALSNDFDDHGIAAVETVRKRNPEVYLKIIGAVVPAKLESTVNVNVFQDYDLQNQREFMQAYAMARSMIGAQPPMIDITPLSPEAETAFKSDSADD